MKVSSLRCYKTLFQFLSCTLYYSAFSSSIWCPNEHCPFMCLFSICNCSLTLAKWFHLLILFFSFLLFQYLPILSIQTTCSSILGKFSWRRTGHTSYKHFVTLFCSSKRGIGQSIVCGRDFLHSNENSQTRKSLILTSWHITKSYGWVCLMQLARPVVASKSFVQIWGFIK